MNALNKVFLSVVCVSFVVVMISAVCLATWAFCKILGIVSTDEAPADTFFGPGGVLVNHTEKHSKLNFGEA